MKREKFETGKQPHISISRCKGELVIRGWDDLGISVKGDDYTVEETDTEFSVNSNDRLRVMAPIGATVSVSRVDGDLVIKNVAGEAILNEVTGDVILVGLGDVKVDEVHNDLSAKSINGSINVKNVHGDVVARNIHDLVVSKIAGDISARFIDGVAQLDEVMGDISLRNVTGEVSVGIGHRDANLRNLEGVVTVSDIRGDIRLRGSLPEGKHSLSAKGDIIVRWPEDASMSVTANAPVISNRLEFDQVVEAEESLVGNIDESEIFLTLNAEGRIILKSIRIVDEKWEWEQAGDADFDFFSPNVTLELSKLGERINTQVNAHLSRVASDLEDKFGPEFSQKISEKIITKQAERAAVKAEKAAQKAIRRAEHSMKHSRWQGRKTRTRTSPEAKKKASSEEQLKILKMVEKGIITTAEASILLEALDN